MPGITSYTKNKLIDFMFRGQPFVPPSILYYALIKDITQGGNEVSGAGYQRSAMACSLDNYAGTQADGSITVSSGTSGRTSNNVMIQFAEPSGDWGLISQVWVYDAVTGGNCIAKGTLAAPKTINNGDPSPMFIPAAFSFTLTDNL